MLTQSKKVKIDDIAHKIGLSEELEWKLKIEKDFHQHDLSVN